MQSPAVTRLVEASPRGVFRSAQPAILVADDDEATRAELASWIRQQGCTVEIATDLAAALGALARAEFDLVFADVPAIGGDAALLAQMRERRSSLPVVLMTRHATVADAVEAMQAGAHDYLVKPLDPAHVRMLLGQTLERRASLRSGGAAETSFVLKSANPAMAKVIATARRVAASDLPVLLTGESGVGKSMLATCIHAWSRRGTRAFATVPCTAVADHCPEAELFGNPIEGVIPSRQHLPAWREALSGGTLLLDEVDALPRQLQGDLLCLLATPRGGMRNGPTVNARVIAATTCNLEEQVAAGRFREDLFFRLNVVTIAIPPLRKRPEDLVTLTDHLLTRLAACYGREAVRITPELRQVLATYHWPGNTRELVNVLESALVLSQGSTITPGHLPDRLLGRTRTDDAPVGAVPLRELERRHIERVVAESRTLEEAAVRLGVNATTLWRRRKRYGMATGASPDPSVGLTVADARARRRPHAIDPDHPHGGSDDESPSEAQGHPDGDGSRTPW